ncbi:MAG TPA: glucose 1-dehydrogenase [Candidatus Thermoplasmatota archaeon]|nr:glucose 1-dehydrogenase [Candidatus Thermoplasmatota archaeon]
MKGKVAIVTGAASGIGAAIADRLGQEGCAVVIADVDAAGAENKAKELQARDVKALAVACDVTKWEDCQRAAKHTKERFGRIDVLVNNAGWDRIYLFKDTTPDFWSKVTEINFLGQVRMVKACLDAAMLEQKSGRIINIASDAGRNGSTGEVVYSGAKGGVIGFTKAIAREVARYNITVNCVCPGPTDTPLLRGMMEKDELAKKLMGGMEQWIPLKRLAKPEEIAPAVAFFASDDAGYITGQTLSVSGGLTMM